MGSTPSCLSDNQPTTFATITSERGEEIQHHHNTTNRDLTITVETDSDENDIEDCMCISPELRRSSVSPLELYSYKDDAEVWSVSTTPESAADEDADSNLKKCISNDYLLELVGWEVEVEGLGIGQLVSCLSHTSVEVLFLVQLQDGRKCVLPMVTSCEEEGCSEVKLLQPLA